MRLAAVLLLLLCTNSHAGPLEDKTRKLFEVQGVVKNFQDMIDQGRVQAQEETKKTVDQMLTQLSPSQKFREQISVAADQYIKRLQANRTADEIVDVLIQNYAPSFTEQELDKLIEFYGSSVGKKDAVVSKTATQKVADYYKADNERIRSSATNEFIQELQRIAKECNCAKQAKSKS